MSKNFIYKVLGLNQKLYSDAPEVIRTKSNIDDIKYIKVSGVAQASFMISFTRRYFDAGSQTAIGFLTSMKPHQTAYFRYIEDKNIISVSSKEIVKANGYDLSNTPGPVEFEKIYIGRKDLYE